MENLDLNSLNNALLMDEDAFNEDFIEGDDEEKNNSDLDNDAT